MVWVPHMLFQFPFVMLIQYSITFSLELSDQSLDSVDLRKNVRKQPSFDFLKFKIQRSKFLFNFCFPTFNFCFPIPQSIESDTQRFLLVTEPKKQLPLLSYVDRG